MIDSMSWDDLTATVESTLGMLQSRVDNDEWFEDEKELLRLTLEQIPRLEQIAAGRQQEVNELERQLERRREQVTRLQEQVSNDAAEADLTERELTQCVQELLEINTRPLNERAPELLQELAKLRQSKRRVREQYLEKTRQESQALLDAEPELEALHREAMGLYAQLVSDFSMDVSVDLVELVGRLRQAETRLKREVERHAQSKGEKRGERFAELVALEASNQWLHGHAMGVHRWRGEVERLEEQQPVMNPQPEVTAFEDSSRALAAKEEWYLGDLEGRKAFIKILEQQ